MKEKNNIHRDRKFDLKNEIYCIQNERIYIL